MKKQVLFIALGIAIAASLATAAVVRAADATQTVKVFVLAGQSNMEGGGAMNESDRTVDPRFRVMADFDNPARNWKFAPRPCAPSRARRWRARPARGACAPSWSSR